MYTYVNINIIDKIYKTQVNHKIKDMTLCIQMIKKNTVFLYTNNKTQIPKKGIIYKLFIIFAYIPTI